MTRKRGAPPKAAGGLTRVLYVRASHDLIALVDARVKRERAKRKGAVISRGDIVRELLYAALSIGQPP